MKHLLNTLLICFLLTGVAFACPPDGAKADAKVEKSENAAMVDVQFASLDLDVKGMTCAGCENKVRAALTSIDGVVETKKVCSQSDKASLTYDPSVVSEEEIMSVLTEKTGYAIAVAKNAGKLEQTAGAKKECASKASKSSCQKAKASADKKLEKE